MLSYLDCRPQGVLKLHISSLWLSGQHLDSDASTEASGASQGPVAEQLRVREQVQSACIPSTLESQRCVGCSTATVHIASQCCRPTCSGRTTHWSVLQDLQGFESPAASPRQPVPVAEPVPGQGQSRLTGRSLRQKHALPAGLSRPQHDSVLQVTYKPFV